MKESKLRRKVGNYTLAVFLTTRSGPRWKSGLCVLPLRKNIVLFSWVMVVLGLVTRGQRCDFRAIQGKLSTLEERSFPAPTRKLMMQGHLSGATTKWLSAERLKEG